MLAAQIPAHQPSRESVVVAEGVSVVRVPEGNYLVRAIAVRLSCSAAKATHLRDVQAGLQSVSWNLVLARLCLAIFPVEHL
jgi:hypothetical protein